MTVILKGWHHYHSSFRNEATEAGEIRGPAQTHATPLSDFLGLHEWSKSQNES